MTPDVIGVIAAIFVAAVTFLGGVAGLLARQSKAVEARFDRVDARFDRVEAEVAAVRAELVDVKIAVARLEGPFRRLLRPSH